MSSADSERTPVLVDGRQSTTALRVQRGVMRFLRGVHDMACYAEVPLTNGRRADVLGVGPKGEIWIVEIKSSVQDFRVDTKWHEYREFCDRFFFCKPPELDDIFPAEEGLMVADGHEGAILRPAPLDALAGARRKALMLRLARIGADRVHGLMDPGPGQTPLV
ncbi:MmcB family DNA repair protein [Pelagibacterium halotolerans]|uniref:MmcB family DNA repair protein n=1 Tax=Pelagibacterium halotolerans TaxID=531813 RepID=UPI00384E001C